MSCERERRERHPPARHDPLAAQPEIEHLGVRPQRALVREGRLGARRASHDDVPLEPPRHRGELEVLNLG